MYQAFPFSLGEVGEDSTGSDPNLEIQVDNVSQALQYYVEEAGGGNNTEVIVRVVNSKALDEATAEVEEHYVVQKCTVNQQYITFTLGSGYSSKTRRPLNRYMKITVPLNIRGFVVERQANWQHVTILCRTAGSATTANVLAASRVLTRKGCTSMDKTINYADLIGVQFKIEAGT